MCGLCGCPLRVKLRLDMKFVAENTPEEMIERFPSWCWVRHGAIDDSKKPVQQ
jgi:hypothetical protein